MLHMYDIFTRVHEVVTEKAGSKEVALRAGRNSSSSMDTFTDDNGGVISWTTEALITEPKVGDITEGGIRLIASDWTQFAPELSYYINRLICANGMVRSFPRPIEIGANPNNLADRVAAVADEIINGCDEKLLSPFAATNQHVVEDPIDIANHIIKDRGLNTRIGKRFLENINRMMERGDPPFTMYDIINELTVIQNEDGSGWNIRSHVQHIGGLETIEQVERCQLCHHKLAV